MPIVEELMDEFVMTEEPVMVEEVVVEEQPIDINGTIISKYQTPSDIPTMDEILSAQEFLLTKEAADKSLLDRIGIQSTQVLNPNQIEWVTRETPNMFPILEVTSIPPLDILSIDDLVNDNAMILVKEEQDKQSLLSIGVQSPQALRPTLLQWAKQGFPAAYPLLNISIHPPTLCSDGVARTLEEYIMFCSGKSLFEHVQTLQCKLTGMILGFTNMGSYLSVVVSKS